MAGAGPARLGSENSPGTTFRHAALLKGIACSEPMEVKKILRSSSHGLSEPEAARRLELTGKNEIASEKTPWHRQLARVVHNRFNLLVMLLALVSYLTHDIKGAVVMASMVVLAVSVTFLQERRSTKAAEKLKAMVDTRITVIRRRSLSREEHAVEDATGTKLDIPLADVVPGDLVHLSAGDIIPGDLKLFTAKDLYVNQSPLTGETIPVEKSAVADPPTAESLLEFRSLCFMGTNVTSGSATGIVVKTGGETYFGSIASRVLRQRAPTSFDIGVQRFTQLLLRFMVVMVPLVFLINGLTKGNWFEAFLFAVAVAVGLTPEMLPMIVTVNLAKGALEMARRKVIVKRLGAIQNFGAMDVLCTDKTGTLTNDEVIFSRALSAQGENDARVLELALLNSSFQTGLKNFLDLALVKHATSAGLAARGYRLLDEVPFDFARKRMSVLVQSGKAAPLLICKGSVEEVLGVCNRLDIRGEKTPMSEGERARLRELAHRANDEGERLIALAYDCFPEGKPPVCSLSDESNLVFSGFLAFADPSPKETAAGAIRALKEAGIDVKILTGDNERVTRKVAEAVGIPAGTILTGRDIEPMTFEQLRAAVETTSLFAKLTPEHKQRIVDAVRARDHVVGFLGDGINDAPALRSSDVGISVNNAVDIAKESADIILLEKDLGVLEAGVIEGRKTFCNIVKYIRMGASSNFGNVFSVLGASFLLPFLPMLPVQMLIQNLLYDFSQVPIPFDRVDVEFLARPRRWEIGNIGRFMLFLGPVSSLFDYVTFFVLWHFLSASSPSQQGLFQAGWFIEGLLSQTLIVHIIRTHKIPIIQSRPAPVLLVSTLIIMAVGAALPFSALGVTLGFMPPPLSFFPWLVAILAGYCVLAHAAKTWFIRRYGYG